MKNNNDMKQMTGEMRIVEEPKRVTAMHPKKFALWLFLASVFILFAGWTSAYIVRRAEGDWVQFDLPALFTYSSIVIVISSITMQWAYFAARKDQLDKVKALVWTTTGLGLVFLVLQVMGFGALVSQSVHLVGNPSGSFVYLITGFHGLHVISAIIFLLVVSASAANGRIHSGRLAQMEMCTTYWHFLGALWVYLFVFFLLNR